MEEYKFLQTKERIPIKFRINKEETKKLFDYIADNNIITKNPYLYPLASWANINFKDFNKSEKFSEIKTLNILEPEETYDLEVDDGYSYIANGIICHNTHNLPKDIKEEEVNNIYFYGWKVGCKGLTIYRDGSRAGVLIKKEENTEFKESVAPKRPRILESDYYVATANGIKYAVIIGLYESKPYEVFAFEDPPMHRNVKGKTIKVKKGHYKFVNGEFEIDNIQLAANRVEERTLTLSASMLLRHGAPIKHVIHVIKKIDENITSFSSAVRRYLARYIEEELNGESCPHCGDKLIMQDGCVKCINPTCSYSRCS